MRSRAVFRDEPDAAADLDVTVRIVRIGDRKRDGAGCLSQVGSGPVGGEFGSTPVRGEEA